MRFIWRIAGFVRQPDSFGIRPGPGPPPPSQDRGQRKQLHGHVRLLRRLFDGRGRGGGAAAAQRRPVRRCNDVLVVARHPVVVDAARRRRLFWSQSWRDARSRTSEPRAAPDVERVARESRQRRRRRRLDVQVAGHVGPGQGVQRDERRISVQLIDFSKRLEKLKTNQQPKLPRDCSGVFLEVARKKTNPWFWMKIKKRSSSFSFSICVHCLHWREKHETVKKTGLSWKHKIIFYRIGGCMSTPS